jgi:hypothetical protein
MALKLNPEKLNIFESFLVLNLVLIFLFVVLDLTWKPFLEVFWNSKLNILTYKLRIDCSAKLNWVIKLNTLSWQKSYKSSKYLVICNVSDLWPPNHSKSDFQSLQAKRHFTAIITLVKWNRYLSIKEFLPQNEILSKSWKSVLLILKILN